MLLPFLVLIVLLNEGLLAIRLLAVAHRARVSFLLAHFLVLAVSMAAMATAGSGDTLFRLLAWLSVSGFTYVTVVPVILSWILSRRLDEHDFLGASRVMAVLRYFPAMGDAREQLELYRRLERLRHGDADPLLSEQAEVIERKVADHVQHGGSLPLVPRVPDMPLSETAAAARLEVLQQIHDLFLARRWREAVELHETLLGGTFDGLEPVTIAMLARAHGILGNLPRMTEAVQVLERRRDRARDVFSLNVARIVFMAYRGAAEELDSLLHDRSGILSSAPRFVRPLYRGIAHYRAGDRERGLELLARATALAPERDQRLVQAAVEEFLAVYGTTEPTVATESFRAAIGTLRSRLLPYAAIPGTTLAIRELPVTWAISAINVVLWVLVELRGSSMLTSDLIAAGALFSPAITAGEWWRLLSAMFLHGGLLHLAMNTIGLFYLGRITERLYGSHAYFAVYLLSGLVGSIVSWQTGVFISVGASGAVYGVLGGLIALLLKGRERFPEAWRQHYLNWMLFLGGANVLLGFQIAQIDNAAHLGGLGAGFLVGSLLARRRADEKRSPMTRVLLGATLAGGSALLVASGILSATTPLERTRERVPPQTVEHGRLTLVDAPGTWLFAPDRTELYDPTRDVGVRFVMGRARRSPTRPSERGDLAILDALAVWNSEIAPRFLEVLEPGEGDVREDPDARMPALLFEFEHEDDRYLAAGRLLRVPGVGRHRAVVFFAPDTKGAKKVLREALACARL